MTYPKLWSRARTLSQDFLHLVQFSFPYAELAEKPELLFVFYIFFNVGKGKNKVRQFVKMLDLNIKT